MITGTFRRARALRAAAALFAGFVSLSPAAPGGAAPAVTDARDLPDAALAAQVIMTGVDARGALSAAERERLRAVPAGAVMLFRRNLGAGAEGVALMNAGIAGVIARSCGVAPFIAADHEGGAVSRFDGGPAALPAPLSYGELAREEGAEAALGRLSADAARAAAALAAMGVTLNLAPVAEPLTPENAAFLGGRSFGPDAGFAGEAAAAFVRAMGGSGVACVLKHFPGSTGVDPHRALPVWEAGDDALRRAAAPFAFAIRAAAPAAVMLSHTVVPAWDAERPASLSPAACRRLREDFGFGGFILADDFSMGAVSKGMESDRAAVLALAAGADMVMAWPSGLARLHGAILEALYSGELPRARLTGAAGRVIRAKQGAARR